MKTLATVLVVLVVAMFGAMLAPLASADTLNTADSFAVLGGAAVTNTGVTTINGNVGVSPGSSLTGTGLCPAAGCFNQTGGTIATASVAGLAQADATNAFNTLALLPSPPSNNLTGTDLGGLTLTAGVYSFSTSAQLTGPLVLNAQGLSNQLFVFQIGSTLTTASASSVSIINPGANDGVFWVVGSSATLGTTTSFLGNILASASITFDTGATDDCGRALAETGAVTLDTNTISIGCANVQGESGSNGLGGGTTAGTGGGEGGGTSAPEPGTLGLELVGLSGLCFFAWRRHKHTVRPLDFC
jgi:hypothetical protein